MHDFNIPPFVDKRHHKSLSFIMCTIVYPCTSICVDHDTPVLYALHSLCWWQYPSNEPVVSWGFCHANLAINQPLAVGGWICRHNSPMVNSMVNTSSTAQGSGGSGGSFKNKKPIGELGCCESGMADRIH